MKEIELEVLLYEHLGKFKKKNFKELVSIAKSEYCEAFTIDFSGVKTEVEIMVHWDGAEDGDIRITGAINTRGSWRVFHPTSGDLLIHKAELCSPGPEECKEQELEILLYEQLEKFKKKNFNDLASMSKSEYCVEFTIDTNGAKAHIGIKILWDNLEDGDIRIGGSIRKIGSLRSFFFPTSGSLLIHNAEM
jgi:hypothetical protein